MRKTMDLLEVKSLLKTYCKQNHYKSPKYKTVFINEENYQKLYTISVEIKGVLTVADSAISRRIAEKKAAIKALVELRVVNKDEVSAEEEEVVINYNNDINGEPRAEPKPEQKIEVIRNVPDPIIKIKVNEVSPNSKNIVLKSSPKKPKPTNDIKFIDENLNIQPKKTQNQLNGEPILKTHTSPKEQNENISDLDENPICGLIKYCLREGIPLPFYDFNFNDGLFSTQCRIETNGTEFLGLGRSSTLRVAKMIASQEVIEELKKLNLYFPQKGKVDKKKNDNQKSTGIKENKYTEYSEFTINMKSMERKKMANNVVSNSETMTYPKTENFEEFKEFDRKNYSSTLESRDDNNNQKDSHFNTIEKSSAQNNNLIIDNPIGYLQKYCTKNKLSTPVYEEVARSGSEHCPLFRFNCSLDISNEQIIGSGLGNTKKLAKKAAAEEVIKLLFKL